MLRQKIIGIIALLLLLTVVWMHGAVAAQEGDLPGDSAIERMPGLGMEMTPFDAASPNVGFITSNLPTCSQPDPAINTCYINWDTLYVSGAPATYMLAMTVTINSRIRAVYRGFFQDYLYADNEMHGKGFKVACGGFGASGDPLTGLRHTFMIQAEDSNRAKATNTGSVSCPAVRLVYLPVVIRS